MTESDEFGGALFSSARRRNDAVLRWLVAGDQSAREVDGLPAPTVAELIDKLSA